MKLTVSERLVLNSLLPEESNFLTLRLVRKLRDELSFDENEHKLLNFQQVGTKITWKPEKAEALTKEINIGEILFEVIKKALKKLNDESKLKEEYISLYEKFVGE